MFGNRAAHLIPVGSKFRSLQNKCAVYLNRSSPLGLYQFPDLSQKLKGTDVLEAWIGVWKIVSDVSQTCRSEKGIAEGVEQDISVGVSNRTVGSIRYLHTSKHQPTPLFQSVNIVAETGQNQ